MAQNISWRRNFRYDVNLISGEEMWWCARYPYTPYIRDMRHVTHDENSRGGPNDDIQLLFVFLAKPIGAPSLKSSSANISDYNT